MAKTSPIEFFQQVRQEVSRVTWPTRKETMVTTAMVFVMVFIAAALKTGPVGARVVYGVLALGFVALAGRALRAATIVISESGMLVRAAFRSYQWDWPNVRAICMSRTNFGVLPWRVICVEDAHGRKKQLAEWRTLSHDPVANIVGKAVSALQERVP